MIELSNINKWIIMKPKKSKINVGTKFGKRLAELRKAKGITQTELAKKIGTTQRMIAYYEGPSDYVPADLLPRIAKVLKVTTDELLGVKNPKDNFTTNNPNLWRKLRNIEKLPAKDQKAIIHYLEALLTKNQN
jgi:transcriptional regulator with XRE-family HTH domain